MKLICKDIKSECRHLLAMTSRLEIKTPEQTCPANFSSTSHGNGAPLTSLPQLLKLRFSILLKIKVSSDLPCRVSSLLANSAHEARGRIKNKVDMNVAFCNKPLDSLVINSTIEILLNTLTCRYGAKKIKSTSWFINDKSWPNQGALFSNLAISQ